MRNVVVTLSGLLLVAVFAACTELSRVEDSLANAIRDTGFVCAEVSSSYSLSWPARSWRGASSDLTEDGSGWHVFCENGHAYLASLEQDGQICVSPFAYVDVPPFAYVDGRAAAETSLESLPYIIQLPPQYFDVVRCTPEGARPG